MTALNFLRCIFSRASIAACSMAALVVSAQAQTNNNLPGSGPGAGRRGGGPGVESGPGSAYRSPEVNTNNSLTFRLMAPNAKSVRVVTDMPKLGKVTVHGSAGYDMVKDEASGIWSYTTPPLPPSYYQYWFIVDGLTTPDPMNTFVRPATEDGAINGARASHAAMTEKNIKHIFSEDPGYGHDYQIWRIYLHTLLQKTFRD